MNFSIGSDPEFILLDQNNNPKSAIGILKNKKKSKNNFYYDNVLCECNILPSYNKKEFKNNIKNSLENLIKLVKPYHLSTLSHANFSKKELNHPDAKIVGCAPEYCAYELSTVDSKKNEKIIKNTGFRCAGGHIHLGNLKKNDHNFYLMLVRTLDIFLGVPYLIIDPNQSNKRRKMYGLPGRYRLPTHGIEYRTIGNFWLSSPELVDLTYDLCEYSIEFVLSEKYKRYWEIDEEKLNSDEFWNSGGDPASCHVCFGYNVETLRNSFLIEKEMFAKENHNLFEFCLKNLPKCLSNKITEYKNLNCNIKSNWNL